MQRKQKAQYMKLILLRSEEFRTKYMFVLPLYINKGKARKKNLGKKYDNIGKR